MDPVALPTEPPGEAPLVRLPTLLLLVLPEIDTLSLDTVGSAECPMELAVLPWV